VFKVTRSSRERERERRVEITTTYGHGIEPNARYQDIVLGYETETQVFVGLDPERLSHGGSKANASTFLESGGLRRSAAEPFLILTRQTKIFPQGEHQAFFRPERIEEYLQNCSAIHAGGYPSRGVQNVPQFDAGRSNMSMGAVPGSRLSGDVLVLRRRTSRASANRQLTARALVVVDEPVQSLQRRQITPEELHAIQQLQEQNGLLGEEFVYQHEIDTLRSLGLPGLARKVRWVSRTSVGEGYDIRSFEAATGEPRYIEVKSSGGPGGMFDISKHEWNTAAKLGRMYYIYCVSNVRDAPMVRMLRDPVALERGGKIQIDASGWRVLVSGTTNVESCHGALDGW